MPEQKFAIGDLVELLSGGPIMTVEKLHKGFEFEGAGVSCQWFSGKKLEWGNFPPGSLKKAEKKVKDGDAWRCGGVDACGSDPRGNSGSTDDGQ